MKVWTDKYVETRGLIEFDGYLYEEKYACSDDRAREKFFLRLGRDAWKTREEAVASARKRLRRKLAGVEVKRRKLERLLAQLGGIA